MPISFFLLLKNINADFAFFSLSINCVCSKPPIDFFLYQLLYMFLLFNILIAMCCLYYGCMNTKDFVSMNAV